MSGSSIRATILDRLRSLIFFYGVLYITWNRGLPVSGASSHLQDLMHNVAKLDLNFVDGETCLITRHQRSK
jgi:hypothetical protein